MGTRRGGYVAPPLSCFALVWPCEGGGGGDRMGPNRVFTERAPIPPTSCCLASEIRKKKEAVSRLGFDLVRKSNDTK